MGLKMLPSNVLTDRLLRSWARCRRKAWLDLYGENSERLWTSHRNLQLDYQQRCFVSLMPKKPSKGLNAFQKGEAGVLGIRLKGRGPNGEAIEIHPPLLQRIQGESKWGDFAYRPVLARHGKRLNKEIRLSLALTGHLLGPFQQAHVSEGLVLAINNQKLEAEKIRFTPGLMSQLEGSLHKLTYDLRQKQPPEITTNRKKCTLCSWRGVCNAEAKIAGHLSEVSGIGSHRSQIINQLGIKNLQELASKDPEELEKQLKAADEKHDGIAHELVNQARVQKNNMEERISPFPALPELKNSSGVLVYDIESDPDEKEDFLHGFLIINRNSTGELDLRSSNYHPILALGKDGEKHCWERLKHILKCHENKKILHYGETEITSICRLAKSQGATNEEIINLRKRFIDLHIRVKSHWRLPINGYGLKNVANWIGFKWRKKGTDGAKALLWWRHWKGTGPNNRGNTQSLRWIFQYNHDDNLATWAVTKWLLEKDLLIRSPTTPQLSLKELKNPNGSEN